MCTEPAGQTVACLRLIWDEPSVKGLLPVSYMRCSMCIEPVGQTVACLRLIRDEMSVKGLLPVSYMR
jgi:hypothetical protein